jgi:hypothetical protein
MKSILKTRSFAAAAAVFLTAGAASAAPPPNLAGTTWTLQANREVSQLVITSQGGPGAPGAATCRHIFGTIGSAAIRGWYCPSTGRVHFQHVNAGITARAFTGNVSDEVLGQPLFMAGTMLVEDAAHGDLGETNFSAVK